MKAVTLLVLAATVALRALAAEASLSSPRPEEDRAGWRLLFDGKTFAGWRGYRLAGLPTSGWEIRDGCLHVLPNQKGVELITEEKFTDFELSWDWRIAERGNNGVKYFVTENRPQAPGHEYQMVDDVGNSDGRVGPHRQTASFYDVLPPAADKPLNPPGHWNSSRIVVRGKTVEHWLNGKRVLFYELGSPELRAALAKSKFKNQSGFGEKISGYIMLTYHEDECWFRNIRIRTFNPET